MKKSVLFLSAFMLFTLTSIAQEIKEEELKLNVQKISNSTEKLKSLEPVSYDYNNEKYKGLNLPAGNQYGFLAKDVKNTFPELVKTSSKVQTAGKNSSKVLKYSEVDQEELIPLLVAAIKEQQEEIELLKEELKKIKSK
ncbi:tail fiber domain-containing protein [Sphingobacterium sp. HJSM2_6]|uniref:tail fiber domain-containing protein n=1 Tax=Sphingobacterium sp. HJSM2_6 TaxID=3366264 RepID=UPI003BECC224